MFFLWGEFFFFFWWIIRKSIEWKQYTRSTFLSPFFHACELFGCLLHFPFWFDWYSFVGSKCYWLSKNHWCPGWEWKSDSLGWVEKSDFYLSIFFFLASVLCKILSLEHSLMWFLSLDRTLFDYASSGAKTWKDAHLRGYLQLPGSSIDYCFWP